ncbi:MAG: hypothetical protein HFH38_15415 [Lachnospiraceae bacterium]|jgi:hypothetical protein|nr:hypothetical protein [Lachnospiraceae bacterium]
MDGRIREIYNSLLQKNGGKGRIGKEVEQEILNMLKGMEKLEGQEREECRDNLYVIACAAEEDGFVKGFRYASWLFAECMRDGFTED